MAETANIAQMAEEVSTRIFSLFGWQLCGIFDANYDCCIEDHSKKTHPYDCVFYYDDPRVKKRIYLVTDLKSYAKKTITPKKLDTPLRNIAKAVECAYLSKEWKDEVIHDDVNSYEIHGLLFVYNHDKEFDSNFERFEKSLSGAKLSLPKTSRVFVMNPEKIRFLEMITNDLEKILGQKKISDISEFRFFYPNKLLTPIPETTIERLPIELILYPQIIVNYDTRRYDNQEKIRGYLVYYEGSASSADECHFLLNYILRQRLLSEDHTIEIRAPFASHNHATNFQKAQERLTMQYHNVPEFKTRIDAIKFLSISQATNSFSEKKIGLDRRNRASK
ncbi:hypothetical protein SAMN02745181_1089 [Rubritalea squalenifaciens DSM 18772]|uniref:GAPS4 PD-(D/E)XK nuclease domain-containing protein n=1 Tax=Rubritalea squalenifaciens DSM 18772 TaxID=1123071 RepID=A0A1M6EQ46_9BACT|nr:hypothetical protein [Rubritalea squalenifaciens]SHI87478.1 hypothetical protein SAMN02745181_1089 [Rubritalea squalenifaciens DSM 18772]